MKHVVIIGGGFAGLSAAVALAGEGVRITLLEGRKHLGGRAYSFTDKNTGDTLDNGQHLLMSCYRHTRDFLSTIGTEDKIHFQDQFQIDFHHHSHGPSRLAFSRFLPSPFHLLFGFLRFHPIQPSDILGLRRIEKALSSPLQANLSVDQWLNNCGQSQRIRKAFWDPLCVSTLNAAPQEAPAKHLIAVLKEAFFGKRKDALLGYSKVGLSSLYTDAAKSYIEERGGKLQIGSAVSNLDLVSNTAVQVHQKIGSPITADACICAVPPPSLSALLPEGKLAGLKQTLCSFTPSSIISVNLWFDRPVIQTGFLGLLDTTMDWVFNRHVLFNGQDRATKGQVTLVASAANHLADLPDYELVNQAIQDLRPAAPLSESANLQHQRVVRERRATFLLPPGRNAPSWRTEHSSLFLAGDWVDTGLPATIESAVISGRQAASQALSFLRRT